MMALGIIQAWSAPARFPVTRPATFRRAKALAVNCVALSLYMC
jgi:hypothetical protein